MKLLFESYFDLLRFEPAPVYLSDAFDRLATSIDVLLKKSLCMFTKTHFLTLFKQKVAFKVDKNSHVDDHFAYTFDFIWNVT